MTAAINRTNIAMLSREIRSNDWRINGLERKLDALSAKIDDLLEEGIGGDTGGDSGSGGNGGDTGGDSGSGGNGGDTGGDSSSGGNGGKLTFKLNENIRYITTGETLPSPTVKVWNVYTTTQTFNVAPTAIDGVDAIYLVDNSTTDTTYLDAFTGGNWRFLSSDYSIRIGDTMYYTTAETIVPLYTIANIETDNGTPRTIFSVYSQGLRDINDDIWIRTIGTPAAIRNTVLSPDGIPYSLRLNGLGGAAFTLTTDYFATSSLLEEYKANGTIYVNEALDGDNFTITDNMQLFDTVLSNIYVIVTPPTNIKAFEVSYH